MSIRRVEVEANVAFSLLLYILLKWWITTEAGQQLAFDKKSGAFELLLSTPLTVQDIVGGQRLALRWQFLKPLALAVAAMLLLAFSARLGEYAAQIRWTWLAGIAMLVADAIALGWVGMLFGLTAKSHGWATIGTASIIFSLPWLLFACADAGARLWMLFFSRPTWNPSWRFDLGCWFGAGMAADLFFALRARRRLRATLRQLALQPFLPRRRFAWLRDWFTGSPEPKAQLWRGLRRFAVATTSLLMLGAGLVFYDIHLARIGLAKPLSCSVTQSNGPVSVFPAEAGQTGLFFILPDGSLWSWGRSEDLPRQGIAPPQRIGTNTDWFQVSYYGGVAGLRTNGTVWTWGADNEEPKQFGLRHDWVEVRAGGSFTIARNREGRLLAWGNNSQNQLGNGLGPNRSDGVWVGTNRDWKAIGTMSFNNAVVALRNDGTIWTWGDMIYSRGGVWSTTNYLVPTRFCKESNWISFDGTLRNCIRNQAGETWALAQLAGLPGPQAPIATIAQRKSSNAAMIAFGPEFTTNWIYVKYELRTNGTLWATPDEQPWAFPTMTTNLQPAVRFGDRSDWVGIWAANQTMIGLTADERLWTWGVDFGQDSHWTQVFVERVALTKAILRQILGTNSQRIFYSYYMANDHPAQRQPRELIKVENADANERTK